MVCIHDWPLDLRFWILGIAAIPESPNRTSLVDNPCGLGEPCLPTNLLWERFAPCLRLNYLQLFNNF